MGGALNFNNIQHQEVRGGIAEGGLADDLDRKFRSIVDSLEESYYGTGTPGSRNQDGWKHDVSNSFTVLGKTFDKGVDPAASKTLFDGLHGVIWAIHTLTFHWLAQKVLLTPLDENEYRYNVTEIGTVDKMQDAKQAITAFANSQGWTGAQAKTRIEAALLTWFSRTIDINDAIY